MGAAGSCELTWILVEVGRTASEGQTRAWVFNKTRDLFYLQIPPRLTSVLAPAPVQQTASINCCRASFCVLVRCAAQTGHAAVQQRPSRRYGERHRIKPERHVPGFTERAAAVPGAAAQPRAAAEPRRAAEPLRRQPAAAQT